MVSRREKEVPQEDPKPGLSSHSLLGGSSIQNSPLCLLPVKMCQPSFLSLGSEDMEGSLEFSENPEFSMPSSQCLVPAVSFPQAVT